MAFDCICGRDGSGTRNLFTVQVQLLDNTISKYSLSKKCTGLDCLKKIAQEVNLKEISYFGLKYSHNESSRGIWLSLDKNLCKEMKRLSIYNIEDVIIYFKIRFFAMSVESLTEDTIRYFYYLQLRQNIQDKELYCSEEEALMLASYALQAEYGDYDASEHKEDFIQEYQLLPTNFKTEKSNSELYAEIAERHKNYVGMSTTDSEFAYIKYAHQLQCYGHEFHPAKDTKNRAVNIGPCARGVFLKYVSNTSMTYFNWPDIVNMTHSKRLFIVETSSLKTVVDMGSVEDAQYVWQMCVDHHQFYRIGDQSKTNSFRSEQGRKDSSSGKRSSKIETVKEHLKGDEGLNNPAFDDSTLQEDEDFDESKRVSRESGIYGSSESHVAETHDEQTRTSVPSTSRAFQTDMSNNNEAVPAEFLMGSYKTFENKPRCRQHIDPNARSSYPRASPHSAGIDRTGLPVERSVSMIVPSTAIESCVDACSLQTMATSGYSTSTDSGLSNNKSPALSSMSPASLISSRSFLYEDYEVPAADEQCKQLEAVMNGGCLDIEFARIKVKDEQKSTASGLLPENKTRNRYQDILPYEESRVHLDASNNISESNYINASFIKVKVANKPFIYIAAQSPVQSTVSDFLQMIWEQNVKIIVMLYNKNDGPQECYRYWPKERPTSQVNLVSQIDDPSQPCKREFPQFEVTTQFVNKSSCYKSSGLVLRNKKDKQERTVILLQFSHWPHNGIPADASRLLDFMAEVESIRNDFTQSENKNTSSPVVIHCRSGVGRTGVFILADLMIAHLQNQVRQPFNVARVLSKLRSQRMSLIRTVEQYRFVYALLIQYLKNSRLI